MKKTILVTGGSNGIGKEICESLAKKKYLVINLDKKKFFKENILFLKTDLSSRKSIERSFKKIIKTNKNLYGLVNNAGVSIRKDFIKYSLNDWKKTFDVNLNAPFYLSQIFSKFLIKKKIKGVIVNISSIGGNLAFPKNTAYTASKAALKHLTKSMALDLSKYNIRVNSISPGYTEGGMNDTSWKNKKLRSSRSKRSMLNRWAKKDEIANVVIFLLSQSSSFITATNINVDGGWTSKGF